METELKRDFVRITKCEINEEEVIQFTNTRIVSKRERESTTCHENRTTTNNDKYISRALNPSVSNQPEAQSAVHVQLKLSKLHIQLKPSKQRNQRRQKTIFLKNKQTNKQKPGVGG